MADACSWQPGFGVKMKARQDMSQRSLAVAEKMVFVSNTQP